MIKKAMIVSGIVLMMIGCSTTNMHDKTNLYVIGTRISSDKNSDKVKKIAKANNIALNKYKNEEWTFNHNDEYSPPQICVALSGGGIRSGAFSIGVLKGLEEKKYLEKTDILSSVSGGGFALSWYYMQQMPYDKKRGLNL